MSDIYDLCHEAGGMTRYEWERDPKRLAFILARYKFVAKMFAGMKNVLEVGCADGIGSRIVRQHVSMMTAIDIDKRSIEEAEKNNTDSRWDIRFYREDFLRRTFKGVYDGVFALDVLEHIGPDYEHEFLSGLCSAASVCVIGTPSRESQAYASALSKEGHVNCKSGAQLKAICQAYWKNVFLFGMNDEVLHTGFAPMSQYLLTLCTEPR
jgi:2-polyprenyl-3-methyl-5-hydroxy-6-metoxy-1,4-benzoquinol methylase